MKGTVSSTQPAAHLIFPSNVISSWVTQDSKAIAAQLEEELHNLPNSTALDIIITIIDEIIIQQGQLEGLAFTICNYVDAKQLWSCRFSSNDDFVKSIPKLAGILDSSTHTGAEARKFQNELEQLWGRQLQDIFPDMLQPTLSYQFLRALRDLARVTTYNEASHLLQNILTNRWQQVANLEALSIANRPDGHSLRWLKSSYLTQSDLHHATASASTRHDSLISGQGFSPSFHCLRAHSISSLQSETVLQPQLQPRM